MQLDELAGEGQPQAGTLHLLVRCSHLPELLEDRLLILRRDANAGVADRYLYAAVSRPRPYLDPPALWGELQCVGQEVQEHLLDLAFVSADQAYAVGDRPSQRNTPARRPLPHKGE